MEEDIKWLEDYIKRDREARNSIELDSDFDQFCERHCKAIESILKENELAKQTLIKNCNIADEKNELLKENNELKQALIINKNLYEEVCNKNKRYEEIYKNYGIDDLVKKITELEEENKKLNNANKTYINAIQNITPVLMNDYVDKSLIKEIRDKAEVMDYYTLSDVIDDLNKVLGAEK